MVTLAINYLQYEQMQRYQANHQLLNYAEIIRRHRLSHFQLLVHKVISEALQTDQIEEVVQQFMPYAGWAVT